MGAVFVMNRTVDPRSEMGTTLERKVVATRRIRMGAAVVMRVIADLNIGMGITVEMKVLAADLNIEMGTSERKLCTDQRTGTGAVFAERKLCTLQRIGIGAVFATKATVDLRTAMGTSEMKVTAAKNFVMGTSGTKATVAWRIEMVVVVEMKGLGMVTISEKEGTTALSFAMGTSEMEVTTAQNFVIGMGTFARRIEMETARQRIAVLAHPTVEAWGCGMRVTEMDTARQRFAVLAHPTAEAWAYGMRITEIETARLRAEMGSPFLGAKGPGRMVGALIIATQKTAGKEAIEAIIVARLMIDAKEAKVIVGAIANEAIEAATTPRSRVARGAMLVEKVEATELMANVLARGAIEIGTKTGAVGIGTVGATPTIDIDAVNIVAKRRTNLGRNAQNVARGGPVAACGIS
mmetsp:Transcript_27453/g.57997  ORF Transcript_27453/g.57997 Transcript_27453/m.57997 type:complete len:407 (+) Transcript_27453:1926-3146(+)